MIKLIALLLTFSVANAQSNFYVLPKDTSHFEHSLNSHLKNTREEIIILTPSLNYPSLKAKLIQSVSKGVNLTIITHNPAYDPLALIAYENVELLLHSEKSLNDTTIIMDTAFMCHHQGALDAEQLSDNNEKIVCHEDALAIAKIRKAIILLRSHSKRYLE
ncbi:MAG: hypothetical protein Q8R86_08430 [Sulfuricurvum sp.]|nr:hypothetical protein [Sulfuricurvum sp.]